MLIDYLRYEAFNGYLSGFFREGMYNYVSREDCTGAHLRFSMEFLRRRFGDDVGYPITDWHRHGRPVHQYLHLMHMFGLKEWSDSMLTQGFRIGEPPVTSSYRFGEWQEGLEIIVDVAPERWDKEPLERRQYEGVSIIFRRCGPAVATAASGDRLWPSDRIDDKYGTLCGYFTAPGEPAFALTCGHVVPQGGMAYLEGKERIWFPPFRKMAQEFGTVVHHAIGNPRAVGTIASAVDAGLIAVRPSHSIYATDPRAARMELQAMKLLVQEDRVSFRGSGRSNLTTARIAAVTIRKSIDCQKNGQLREFNDVLLLGHAQPTYVQQAVSRLGDSGAAVMSHMSQPDGSPYSSTWCGMVLANDECGAYVNHAEHLLQWAIQSTGNRDLEFRTA